ncbi:hypothetical protein AAHC03_022789 [Spirometra sp. Aus1]
MGLSTRARLKTLRPYCLRKNADIALRRLRPTTVYLRLPRLLHRTTSYRPDAGREVARGEYELRRRGGIRLHLFCPNFKARGQIELRSLSIFLGTRSITCPRVCLSSPAGAHLLARRSVTRSLGLGAVAASAFEAANQPRD